MTNAPTPKPPASKATPKVTPKVASKIAAEVISPKAPVDIELKVTEAEPEPAVKKSAEEIHSEIQSKLNNKTVENNIFVPASPAAVEKAAQVIAEEKGFVMTRGNAIGARLMARAQKRTI